MVALEGKTLGAYKVEELIGKGGMASVYQAYHAPTDRHVAIKVVLPDIAVDDQFIKRFEHEARVQHIHILAVFDYGQHEGVNYLVMPQLPGETLHEYIKSHPLTLTEIADAFEAVAIHGTQPDIAINPIRNTHCF